MKQKGNGKTGKSLEKKLKPKPNITLEVTSLIINTCVTLAFKV